MKVNILIFRIISYRLYTQCRTVYIEKARKRLKIKFI